MVQGAAKEVVPTEEVVVVEEEVVEAVAQLVEVQDMDLGMAPVMGQVAEEAAVAEEAVAEVEVE